MTEQSDLSNAERYAILNAARRVLDEIAHKQRYGDDSQNSGIVYARAADAEDAVFDMLNTLHSYLDDAEAKDAMNAYQEDRDPDLSLFVSELRLMGGNRVHADREAEADAAFEDVRAGDMLGRRP